jgi:hypothetical protein
VSSDDSFSSDSTSGRLPRRNCFTRRETTLMSNVGIGNDFQGFLDVIVAHIGKWLE